MKKDIVFIFLAIMQFHQNSARQTTTMKISDRIVILKKQIRNSLRNPSPHEPIPSYYESEENAPIKPILDDDELKKDDKFKLAKIKSIPTTVTTKLPLRTRTTKNSVSGRLFNILKQYSIITKDSSAPNDFKELGHFIPVTRPNNTLTTKLGFNIFYRRYDMDMLSDAQEWTHCNEHITPYLKGAKKELGRPKKIMQKDHIVHRLINLIRANVTKMTRAEKKTTMYQISKLKIRLYSWHLDALMDLTTLIARLHGRSYKVDFLAIKRGLMNMMAGWQADLSNTTILLRQAKVFRPPCIPRGEQGSSKFVRGSTLSSATSPARFADIECRRRNADDVCV
ncbi:uncharacterized protein LOC133532633 [Cydia pomonella]|uniref:uncharacterized protein LOC133532633 n=1 Tax=Cydia pomonella TaxID=82600 RepID=UPI002ADE2132|nr:uncharacterized protein LOC133532633 [Cydia pomonella]